MKKLLCLLLALMLTLSMAACQSEDKKAAEKSNTPKAPEPITFQEQVLVDNDACMIQITGIDPEGEFGYTLNTTLKNKSAEKTYVFALTDSSANGVIANSVFGIELAPGETANEGICIGDEQLQEALGDFTDIGISFTVSDQADWAAAPVAEFSEHIYPYGKEKATVYSHTASDSDTVVVDNEYVTIIATGYEQDEYYGYRTTLYLVNKTESTVVYGADQVSINGIMADPYFSIELEAGQAAFTDMIWDVTFLQDYEMDKVQEISMVMFAYDQANWDGQYLVQESVVLNP